MESYRYSPLHGEEIRLITLHPGPWDDDLYVELHHEDLSEPAPYEALSYVWGSIDDKVPIRVHAGLLSITRNLASSLRYLRYEDRPRVLWVDAVSMNQRDVPERSHQVTMMGSIFQKAARVVAWIGNEEDDSAYALDYLENLSSRIEVDWFNATIRPSKLAVVDPVLLDHNSWLTLDDELLNAIEKLFYREWFQRLWVRQEIRLANPKAIMCGLKETSWQSFRDGFYYVRLKANRARRSPRAMAIRWRRAFRDSFPRIS
ncbi:heterokaryon incompatibility protein-domain-containing protein [Whalleya microplaca]|nr:heterokaryon incompatibility protein-domain-containing protein [Whalleya microplaca]